MMKKLSIICTCALLVGLFAGPAIAQISYCKDMLEPGNPPEEGVCDIIGGACTTDDDCTGTLTCIKDTLKTWDETWEMNEGETVDMDIWLNDVPESMLTAGCFITYDTALIDITSVVPNDTNNGGQWDAGSTSSFEVVPGQWFLALADFGCIAPDGDGDVLLARATFQCQAPGEVEVTIATIPDFDTLVGCSGGDPYDPDITPNTVTITQNAGAICTVPGDCADDGNLCTTTDCVEGTCVHNPVVCDDPDLCTLSNCDPGTGNCVDVPVDCDDADECTTDSCDPATGCSHESIECDDDDACTINGCDPETGCEFSPVDCDDDNACTEDICNPESGFCSNDLVVDCSDEDLCTQDVCDPGDGSCSNPPLDCDDGVECTDDSCDPASGCLHDANDGNCPDDGIVCTDAICDPVDDCQSEDNCPTGEFCNVGGSDVCETVNCSITLSPSAPDVDVLGTVNFNVVVDGTCPLDPSYTWEISDTGCTGEATGSGIGSTVDETGLYTAGDQAGTDIVRVTDESNGDICATADVTVETTTTTTAIPSGCTANEDCEDGVYCNGEEACVDGSCVDGTPPCAPELCDEETDTCIDCLENSDCDDGVDCTDDSCVDETCVNMPNDEDCPDDGLYCNGEEFCDVDEGCTSSGDPCGANETCDEDSDSCVSETECTIDVLRDSLPKSHWTPLPAVFRIETIGIEGLNLLTSVTIDCEADDFFPSITKAGKIIQPNFGTNTTVIWQTGIIWPAILTKSLDLQSETCTVTVDGCAATDTFELDYLSFIGIPLSK